MLDPERMAIEFYKAWWEHPVSVLHESMKQELIECSKKVIAALKSEAKKMED